MRRKNLTKVSQGSRGHDWCFKKKKKHTNKQGLLSSVTPTHGKVLPSIAFKLIFFNI